MTRRPVLVIKGEAADPTKERPVLSLEERLRRASEVTYNHDSIPIEVPNWTHTKAPGIKTKIGERLKRRLKRWRGKLLPPRKCHDSDTT